MKSDLVETGIVVEDGKNPISKMPVLVSGDQGMVYIDEIPIGAPIDIAAGGDAQPTAGGDDVTMSGARTLGGNQMRNYMLQLQSGILSLRRENIELRNEMERLHQGMERGFATINGNIKRVAMQPARRLATTAVGIDLLAGAATGTVGAAMVLAPDLAMMNPPSLMPNPKSLFDLWDEYLNGVGGRKPARLFSQTERGRVKYKYTRRRLSGTSSKSLSIWGTRHSVRSI